MKKKLKKRKIISENLKNFFFKKNLNLFDQFFLNFFVQQKKKKFFPKKKKKNYLIHLY